MHNPWKDIELKDYENHMSLDSIYQLQSMNKIMKEQIYSYDTDTVMILGIAGGNGLEHIEKEKFKLVYGVDINQDYLHECQNRYSSLKDIFQPICVDLLDNTLQLPSSQLLIANLLIEYIGYKCFQNIIKMVKPQYVSCIIQINTEKSFVSDSPYLHIFDRLNEVHHKIEKDNLTIYMNEVGYIKELTSEYDLPNGKKLMRIDFIR